MHEYLVRFDAINPAPLVPDAAGRLERALHEMPGPERVANAGQDAEGRRVGAEFAIEVKSGMADAARDGSRLAKEGLTSAAMPEAVLVELRVVRSDQPDL
jgi:hypothetical protein